MTCIHLPLLCTTFANNNIVLYRLEDSDEENDSNACQYDAVTCTGRQPCSDVFVFGRYLQLTDSGSVIPPDDQRFLWIDEILQKLQCPLNPLPPIRDFPPNHLSTILTGMLNIAGQNVLSGVYLLGTLILCAEILGVYCSWMNNAHTRNHFTN